MVSRASISILRACMEFPWLSRKTKRPFYDKMELINCGGNMAKAAILNYPGSKRRLLDFILSNSRKYLSKDSLILDIFCGTGSVAEMFKQEGYSVCANDSENYSRNIAYSLLNGIDGKIDLDGFLKDYDKNYTSLANDFIDELSKEEFLLKNKDSALEDFDLSLPKIWKDDADIVLSGKHFSKESDLRKIKDEIPFCLFTLYYSGYYFGLKQSLQIDSIRFAIDHSNNKEILLTSLYFAMKEATFSKDGHMAQPLNRAKNLHRLFKCREKDILDIFKKKLADFIGEKTNSTRSEVYNLPFEELIFEDKILNRVDFIYADPPYTDMQYSRYFHLLNTVTSYDYPELTRKNGKLTTGLYADNRFQSKISNKRSALSELTDLMMAAKRNKCVLAFSYAFPVDRVNQPTDRYTMNIDDLIAKMQEVFPKVDIVKENFKHCNNRNSAAKKVYEYLVIGVPDGK